MAIRSSLVRRVAIVAKELSLHKDLTESIDLTLALLSDPQEWRERLVEEFVFGAGTHARVVSTYQIFLAQSVLEDHIDPDRYNSASIVLPLTTRPKEILFDLDLRGPAQTEALLTPRFEIAQYEAEHLSRLLDATPSAAAMRSALSDDLLRGICTFSPGRFREIAREYSYSRPLAIAQYLSDGLGIATGPSASDVEQWINELAGPARVLSNALREPPQRDSSSENILLALPEMVAPPSTVSAISQLVAEFSRSIESASPSDRAFLSALAEYGRRYAVLITVDVPLKKRCTVQMAESRPLNRKRGRTRQLFALGEAASAHMEARVTDPNVALGEFQVRELNKESVGLGVLNSARKTNETLSLYGSDIDRPTYVEVEIQLRLARFIQLGTVLLGTLSVLAIGAVFLVPRDSLYVERLALLVIPTTLATAVLLTREQSALANELQRFWRVSLAILVLVLWTVMLVELLSFHEHQPRYPMPSVGRSNIVSSHG